MPTSLSDWPGSRGQLGGSASQIGPMAGFDSGSDVGGSVGSGVGLGSPGTGVKLGALVGRVEGLRDGGTVVVHAATARPSTRGATRRRVAITVRILARTIGAAGNGGTAVAPQHDGGPLALDPLTRSAAGRHRSSRPLPPLVAPSPQARAADVDQRSPAACAATAAGRRTRIRRAASPTRSPVRSVAARRLEESRFTAVQTPEWAVLFRGPEAEFRAISGRDL